MVAWQRSSADTSRARSRHAREPRSNRSPPLAGLPGDRLEDRVPARSSGLARDRRDHPRPPARAARLRPRCDGRRPLGPRLDLLRSCPRGGARPAAEPDREGPVDRVLDESRGGRRLHAHRGWLLGPRGGFLRRAGRPAAVRCPLPQLLHHGPRHRSERAPDTRDGLPQPRAPADRRHAGRSGRRHHGSCHGSRRLGDHRPAAHDRLRLDDPALAVLRVEAPIQVLVGELPGSRGVRRTRLRHTPALLRKPQRRRAPHRHASSAQRPSARTPSPTASSSSPSTRSPGRSRRFSTLRSRRCRTTRAGWPPSGSA